MASYSQTGIYILLPPVDFVFVVVSRVGRHRVTDVSNVVELNGMGLHMYMNSSPLEMVSDRKQSAPVIVSMQFNTFSLIYKR